MHGLYISLYIYIYIYILISKVQRKSNLILIGFLILRHMSYLIFNFLPSELMNVKIEESKSNLESNLDFN